MNFLRKISENRIARIELVSFLSDQKLDITPEEGYFSKTKDIQACFDTTYFTVDTPYLIEESGQTDPGYQFKLKFGFTFPTNDLRVKIINRFKFLKLIRVHYCNGKFTDIGRNDYYQNKPLEAEFSTDKDHTKADWSIKTIFPFEYKE